MDNSETALEEVARRRERAAVEAWLRKRNEHVYAEAIRRGLHWPPPVSLDEPPSGHELPQD